jgi:hypothetical protein
MQQQKNNVLALPQRKHMHTQRRLARKIKSRTRRRKTAGRWRRCRAISALLRGALRRASGLGGGVPVIDCDLYADRCSRHDRLGASGVLQTGSSSPVAQVATK